jgi:subtilisin-like proprotein convertase family protein
MGMRSIRTILALALSLALPLGAQDETNQARYQINYKRFTQGNDIKVVDEAWGRLQWFRERMGGDLSPEFKQRLFQEAAKERAKYPAFFPAPGGPELFAAVGGTVWSSLGPTTAAFTQNGITLNKVDSGRPRVILPDTADTTGNTVYVLAAGGGLWKTTNFLSATPAWSALTDFVGSNMSGAAAFGRITSTIFVGSGDPFDPGVGGFMIKSANGGTTWSAAIPLGLSSIIFDVKVDISQAQDIVLVGTNAGLYRSVDGGTSYSSVASLTGYVWSIVSTSAGWLANSVASNGTGSLLLSTDHGATWTPITNAGGVYAGAGRTTLAVGAPGDAVVYAFAATKGSAPFGEPSQQDLYRSTNGGATWTALHITALAPTNPNSDNATMNVMGTQAWYNHMILVDPTDAARNTVYLGGNLSSAKTTSGGTSWTLISNWLPGGSASTASLPYVHADFHCAAYSSFGSTARLYFGTDGGLFTSTDGGTTWDDTKNKGLVNHLVYALAANPGVAGSALVGLQDNGTRIRSGTTSTFNQVRGGDGFGVAWAQAVTSASAVSMSSYVYNSIQRATTSPVTTQANWSTFTTGLGTTGSSDGGSSYYFVTPIITPPATADPSGQVFFTYGNGGTGTNSKKIFLSSAAGWTTIGTAGSNGFTAGRFVRSVSHGLGVSPVDLQHIAAAENGGYVLLTSNGGTSWTEVFLGSTGTDGQNIGWVGFNANIAWANNSLLYICSEAQPAGATRVAKSANGGATWSAAATGLPDVPVTKLAVDPGDATGNTVYAATWLGVYRTTNGGGNWSLFGTGLPQGRASDLWVAPDSSSLRVATWGRGVWEIFAPTPVSFLAQPAAATVAVGHTATFSVQATGSGTLTYQWKKGSTPIGGAINPTYTTPTLALTDNGTIFSCDVTNSVGTVSSNTALLTVQALGTASTSGNSTATGIPDATSGGPGTPVDLLFTVSGLTGTVGEVTFSLYLTHTYVSDLVITLIAPNNTSVILSNNVGGPGGSTSTNGAAFGSSCSNYLVFTDLAPTSIGNAVVGLTTPLTGPYQPSVPLSAFNGLSAAVANGTWKLHIQDTGPGDTGTFQCGSLSVKPFFAPPSSDINGDGVVDLQDLLSFAKYYGTTNASCLFSGDSTVSDADLALLLAGL